MDSEPSPFPTLDRRRPRVPRAALPTVALLVAVDCLLVPWLGGGNGFAAQRAPYAFVTAIGIWAVACAVAGFVGVSRDDETLRRLEGFAGLAAAVVVVPYLAWRLAVPLGIFGAAQPAREPGFYAAPVLALVWGVLARARLREPDMPDRLWYPLERINWYRVRGPARLILVGGAVAALGCLLPWVEGRAGAETGGVNGTLAAGAWIVAISVWAFPDAVRGLGAQGLFAVVFGGGLLLTSVVGALRPSSLIGLDGASPEYGLAVAALGSAALLAGGVGLLRRRP